MLIKTKTLPTINHINLDWQWNKTLTPQQSKNPISIPQLKTLIKGQNNFIIIKERKITPCHKHQQLHSLIIP